MSEYNLGDYMLSFKQRIDRPELKYFSNLECTAFFDIETTGLSAKSQCYLIGFLFEEYGELFIEQFFSENPNEEIEILKAFSERIERIETLVSFNGDMFDIPFLKKRAREKNLPFEIPCKSLDILKLIRPHKSELGVENLKLKTLEKYAGVIREDKYGGGELIPIYFRYVRERSEELRDILLLHNFEDIKNMLCLDKILSGLFKKDIYDFQINSVLPLDGVLKITGDFSVPTGDLFHTEGEDIISVSGHSLLAKIKLEEKKFAQRTALCIEKSEKSYLSELIIKNPPFLPDNLMVYTLDGKINRILIKETVRLLLKAAEGRLLI